ncbi:MAG TPA: hypothetical protein VE262_02080 [Blastocatellia bacterium]|nr:hypothetical protein [Blastocatellia bacterium]
MKRLKRETTGRRIEALARREFAKTLAALAAAPIVTTSLASGAARAQTTPPPDAVASAADALTQVARARYGKHLKEDQIAEIRRSIERGIRTADRLRQVKLDNGDEPSFAFSADFE